MKKTLLLAGALCMSLWAIAENIEIKSFRYAGPYPIQKPFMIDSVDVNSKPFSVKSVLDNYVSLDVLKNALPQTLESLPAISGNALHVLGFEVQNTSYTKAKLQVEGLSDYQAYVDGKKIGGNELTLNPATHSIIIKCLSKDGKAESVKVSLETEKEGILTLPEDGNRLYTLTDVLHGTRFAGVSVSPNGKYLITSYRTSYEGGKSTSMTKITELATGKVVAERAERMQWMPRSNRYYYTRTGVAGRELVTVDPINGQEQVLAEALPDGHFEFSPTEDWLLYSLTQEGPKEKKEIYEVIEPDDRQPGWRNRSYLAKYDLKTGILQPLTFGYHNAWGSDISQDGRYVLVMTEESRLTQRPTTLRTLYRLDVQTLQAEVLVEKDGFMGGAQFSPDGAQVLLTGSPESFGAIGKNVKEGQTPSTIDTQLYLMDIAGKKITPLTKEFNPCVQRVVWNTADGQVYFTAENRDYLSFYRLNPKDGKIQQMDVNEDLVTGFALAAQAPVAAYYGQSASNSDRLYTVETKKWKQTLKEDLSAKILDGVQLGECKAWNFVNEKGDTIYGRYYLPPRFDASKKYPLIVN